MVDFHQNMIEFREYIRKLLPNGFVQYYYMVSDGSKHQGRDRHGVIMTKSNTTGKPAFLPLTTSDPMGASDAEGLATLNFETSKAKVPLDIFAHYGGQTTDNASVAVLERKLTFSKTMGHLQEENYSHAVYPEVMSTNCVNGVEQLIVDAGDLYHINNLCMGHCME